MICSRSRRFHRASRAVRLWLVCLGASSLLAAEAIELPAELPLAADTLEIELWNADVNVVQDGAAEPFLRANRSEGDGTAEDLLELSTEGGLLTVRRPQAAGASPRLTVEVVVDPGQQIRLVGQDLAVSARRQPAEARAAAVSSDEPAPPGKFHLAIESSRADLTGVRRAVVEATESAVWIADSWGPLEVKLEAGSLEVRRHQGRMVLDAARAEVTLIDLRANVLLDLRGGSLEVKDGAGRVAGPAADAFLRFVGWQGQVELQGANATVEARDTGSRQWQIRGDDLQVSLERPAGPVIAVLEGGRFQADGVKGKLTLTAGNRADIELTDLAADADLKLIGAAAAALTGMSGLLKVEVNDAFLTLDGIERLMLTGARSEIQARDIANVNQLEVSDSRLDLDLTTIAHTAAWNLQGTGRAQVLLPVPCLVRIEGIRDLLSDQIEVSGCELRVPGQPAAQSKRWFIYGDRRPQNLTVTLGGEFELEVEGQP